MRIVGLLIGLFLTTHTAFGAEKILVVISAANELRLANGKTHETGFFLGELVEPLEILEQAGFDFDIATPGGVRPTLDADSERWFYWKFNSAGLSRARNFIKNDERLSKPLKLETLTEKDLENYVGLFIPGGHGPMVDLAHDPSMAEILLHFHRRGKPIGLICHSPVALLSLKHLNPWPFSGYSMTVFSNTEEKIAERLFLGGAGSLLPEGRT